MLGGSGPAVHFMVVTAGVPEHLGSRVEDRLLTCYILRCAQWTAVMIPGPPGNFSTDSVTQVALELRDWVNLISLRKQVSLQHTFS